VAKLPLVAIIGRPNTGKSTLFNRLVRKRIAIESPIAGTTRDHVTQKVEDDIDYLLVDTGGMGGGSTDTDFEKDVEAQSKLAIATADVIIFTVDATSEITASDRRVVETLRKKRRRHVPVILALTKCDTEKREDDAMHAFHELQITDVILPVSAAHGKGIGELRTAIIEELKKLQFKKSPILNSQLSIPKIAIVGKPNVGKSSIVNAMMSDPDREHSPRLVSDIPGTTRDSADTLVQHEGKQFILVDTAGLRRKAKVEEDIEGLSMLRTLRSIEDADVVALVIDALEPVSQQDKRIAGIAVEEGKGMLLLLNKMDKLNAEQKKVKRAEVERAFVFCRFATLIPCSAKTRDGLPKIFANAGIAMESLHRRIAQKDLRTWFAHSIEHQPVGEVASSKHLTQASDVPPTFVLFVRHAKKVNASQLRFLENRLRETFGFEGAPIRWVVKGRS
jgi:GTP-binding protein